MLIAACTGMLACDPTILIGSDPEPLITMPGSTERADTGTTAPPVPSMGAAEDSDASPTIPTEPDASAPIAIEPWIDAGSAIDATGPAKGTLLWSSGVESGDTSDWDTVNGYVFTQSGALDVVTEHPRTGRFAIRALLRASTGQAQLFYRTTVLHAVYGVWYCLPALVETPYWALTKLRGGRADDDVAVNDTFDIVVVTESDVYRIGVFDKAADALISTDVTIVPGQWFHLEADYRHEPDVGHLRVYVDGVEAYRTGPRSIGEAPRVEWGVGSTALDANPPGPVFIDDLSVHEAADLE
jgi:hypothetical protein